MSCDYCDKNNTPRNLRGGDGIIQDNGTCYIYVEHFRNEILTIDNVKYCPMCGRDLEVQNGEDNNFKYLR